MYIFIQSNKIFLILKATLMFQIDYVVEIFTLQKKFFSSQIYKS